jgi:hypothetical protein
VFRSRFLAISSKIVINPTSKANTVVIFESFENDFKVTHTKNVAPMLVPIGPKMILGGAQLPPTSFSFQHKLKQKQ